MKKISLRTIHKWIALSFLLFAGTFASGQIDKDYFRSPVDFSFNITGAFAEFRNDHFHSGIDIPAPNNSMVYAVADGYISRIRIQPSGFGLVLYLDHPNGYTSVYAHLNAFQTKIAKSLREEQFRQQTYEIDYFPEPSAFRVNKGDVIAFSGNTGASSGPHLHFEIRHTGSEQPTNPLIYGIRLADPLSPEMKLLRVYATNANGRIIPQISPADLPILKKGDKYQLKTSDTLKVHPYVIFGLQASDLNLKANRNGYHSLEVMFDSLQMYYSVINEFTFDETRSVNAIIDYPYYLKTRRFVELARAVPCSKFNFIGKDSKNGVCDFSDCRPHKVSIRVMDFSGNCTDLTFMAVCDSIKPDFFVNMPNPRVIDRIPCNQFKEWAGPEVKLFLQKKSLFDTLDLEYEASSLNNISYSAVHRIHNVNTPLRTNCILSIKCKNIPPGLQDYLCLVQLDVYGKPSYIGGEEDHGWVTASIKKFGTYAVYLDTISPSVERILPKKIKKGKRKTHPKPETNLRFSISDNFSGIGSYCGYINGIWVLMEYNPKTRILKYDYDEYLKPGVNLVEVRVNDRIGNTKVWSGLITR